MTTGATINSERGSVMGEEVEPASFHESRQASGRTWFSAVPVKTGYKADKSAQAIDSDL